MKHRALSFVAALLTAPLAGAAQDVVAYDALPGWRAEPRQHVAALDLRLDAGWKTYWRVPGDAGIPPVFNWSGSRNLADVRVHWPTPDVFWQAGMRSVGYDGRLILPLVVTTQGSGDAHLKAEVQIGICKDICIPYTFRVEAVLPAAAGTVTPAIAAALAEAPFSETEAGVRQVRCRIAPAKDGLTLQAEIDMPSAGGREETVIETPNPYVWVSDPKTTRTGRTLTATADLVHVEGKPFALDRSSVRITVLGSSHAVDVRGCD